MKALIISLFLIFYPLMEANAITNEKGIDAGGFANELKLFCSDLSTIENHIKREREEVFKGMGLLADQTNIIYFYSSDKTWTLVIVYETKACLLGMGAFEGVTSIYDEESE